MFIDPLSVSPDAKFYIPERWLDRVRGTRLLYPCSGDDIREPLEVFSEYIDYFTFVDIERNYGRPARVKPDEVIPFDLEFERLTGDSASSIVGYPRRATPRRLDPAYTYRRYKQFVSERRIEICWRRGFGQFAIPEQPSGKLGVFMHRGDTMTGEGGSCVWFLSHSELDFEPISNLWLKIEDRLADYALVVTDGSNSRLRPVKNARKNGRDPRPSREAFLTEPVRTGVTKNFKWELVGFLERKYGPTFVWGLERR